MTAGRYADDLYNTFDNGKASAVVYVHTRANTHTHAHTQGVFSGFPVLYYVNQRKKQEDLFTYSTAITLQFHNVT